MAQKPAWAIDARQGPIRRHKQLVFFACEGLIALHDERETSQETGDVYEVLTPADFEFRANELARLAKKMEKSDIPWQRQEGKIWRRGCQYMQEAVKEARYMGDPSDPAVQAFWSRHRRNNTVSFNFECGAPRQSPAEMAASAPDTGRTAKVTLDKQQLDALRLRSLPRRKPRPGRLDLDM
jgi:hypothetical protein